MGTCRTLTPNLILESFFLGGAPVNILLLLGSPTGIAALVRISFGCRAFQKTFGAWSWPFKAMVRFLSVIPLPPLALFVEMLPKAHLTSHSRMSGSR